MPFEFKTDVRLDAMTDAQRIAYWRMVEYEYRYTTDDDASDFYRELSHSEKNALSLLR